MDIPEKIPPPVFVNLSGRKVATLEVGPADGFPVLFFHGGPGSRIEGLLFEQAAHTAGVRLIAFDRPGLGQSDFYPEVTHASLADDAARLCDALSLDRATVMGWSGGGVPALACGGHHPDRFPHVVALASYTLLDSPALWSHVPEPDRTAARMARTSPRLFRSFFHLTRFAIRYTPSLFFRTVVKDACPADRALYTHDDLRRLLLADQREALQQGVDGIVADALLSYADDWGVSLEEIRASVDIYQGTEDTLVPIAFGEDLARRIPGARFHALEGEGHLFPITMAMEILKRAARTE